MDFFNDLILQAVASPWLLPVMVVVALVDGFFPPVPSETLLVAAVAVASSAGDPATVVAVAVAAACGAAIGDNVAYAIGRRVGDARFRWMRRPLVAKAFAGARTALERRGATLILGARYIPVGRVAVNMSAGALGYPWRRFLPLSIIAAGLWAVYSAVIGAVAGRWLADQPLLSAVVGVVVAVVLGVVIDRIAAVRRGRSRRGLASGVPVVEAAAPGPAPFLSPPR